MRTIEINTTQNVVIQYELATAGERIIAYLVDAAIMGAFLLLCSISMAFLQTEKTNTYILYLLMAPVFVFYTLVSEWLMNGQSPGKKILKLKVIKLTGKEPTLSDYLLRWSFRMIDIYFSLGAIASILINSTRQAQRLGDVVANTTIARLNPKTIFSLNDVLKIQTRQDYVPSYPQVTQLNESDLLLVKKTIDRYKQFPNNAHSEALIALSKKTAGLLKLPEEPRNHLHFLRTLINDYVVLTR